MTIKKQIAAMALLEGVTLAGDWTPIELNAYEQNYPQDHNAVQRVINCLSGVEKRQYLCQLLGTTFQAFYDKPVGISDMLWVIEASPAQKVEAILKATGKWEKQ